LAASPGSLVGVVIALETRNAGTNILPKIAAESHEIRQTQKPDQGKIKMGINELGVLHGRLGSFDPAGARPATIQSGLP
jgi:hypothetical protein